MYIRITLIRKDACLDSISRKILEKSYFKYLVELMNFNVSFIINLKQRLILLFIGIVNITWPEAREVISPH